MIPALVTPVAAAAFTVTRNGVVSGAIIGLVIGLLGVGIVLVHRATRVINFAYADIGVFGSAVVAILVIEHGWNFWPALVLGCVVAAVGSVLIELVVVRRLFGAPRVVLFAATLGVSQLVFAATLRLPTPPPGPFPSPFQTQPSRANPDASYSLFGLDIPFEIAGIRFLGRDVVTLLLVPLIATLVIVLTVRTFVGLSVRAAATNPEAARLVGISTRRVSTVVWATSGVLAVVTVTLLIPLLGSQPGPATFALGPGLLLRGLAAALLGRMRSIGATLAGGVFLGVIEGLILFNIGSERLFLNTPGFTMAVLFVVVAASVLVQARAGDEAWSFAGVDFGDAVAGGRALLDGTPRRVAVAVAVTAPFAVPLVITTPSKLVVLSTAALWGIVALSVAVLTGWAGQLSLGQFAFAGVGAMTTASLAGRGIPTGGPRLWAGGVPFVVAVALSVAVCVAAALLIGAPAVRVRGLYLSVATLAFAVACAEWLLRQRVFLEAGETSVPVRRPDLIGSERAYYWVSVTALVGCAVGLHHLRHSTVGRALLAARDNERAAAAIGISARRSKLVAFSIAGGIAGLGGALLAGLRQSADPATFGVTASLEVVAAAIVGGVGTVVGPVLGALWTQGLSAIVDVGRTVDLLRSGVGILVVLLLFPAGLARIPVTVATRLRGDHDPEPTPDLDGLGLRTTHPAPDRSAGPALTVEDLTVVLGGRAVVDGVGFHVDPGEIVGLIGPNGAGKTTLLDAVGGLVPASGSVRLGSTEIGGWPAAVRSRRGLARTLQAGPLFDGLSAMETIDLAVVASDPDRTVRGALARRDPQRMAATDELLATFGLEPVADVLVGELPISARRRVELACVAAADPAVLCLDEPGAGLTPVELALITDVVERMRDDRGMAIVLVEHDLELVGRLCDRLVCLVDGRAIATGVPDVVLADPAVRAAYFGTHDESHLGP